MRLLILIAISLTSLQAADYRTVESRSGQFIVRWREQFRVPPLLLEDEKAAGIIVLTPELLAVSAERIKESLLWQLGASDRWRGKIRFQFKQGKSDPGHFFLESFRFSNGWNYQVTLSPKIRRSVWLRHCVAVLLLEMANRLAGERSAEVPFWLIDGITMELRQSALLDLSPSHTERLLIGGANPGLGMTTPQQLYQDALISTRQWLANNIPAGVDELFFPAAEHLQGDKQPPFSRSAHLFFRQLRALRAGKASFRQFLSSLSSRLNWQQAFFPSFHPHFKNMLDLEKWWAVTLVDFLTNPYSAPINPEKMKINAHPLDESRTALQQILSPLPAFVGRKRNEIAKRAGFTLQQAIAQWDYPDQKTTLQRIINRLHLLSIYAHPQLTPLIQTYQTTLSSYLTERDRAGYQPLRRGQPRRRSQQIVQDTQRKLDRLDAQLLTTD